MRPGWVKGIFDKLKAGADSSLPRIMLDNRKALALRRAEDAIESRGDNVHPRALKNEVKALALKWAAAAFDDAFDPMARFEFDCAHYREVALAKQSGNAAKLARALEQEHRRKIVERFGRIEIRGLQVTHRVLLDLDKVFVPVRLSPAAGDLRGLFVLARPSEFLDTFQKNHRLFITGSPGSGKSTLLSYVATELASRRIEGGWVPFVLTVRSLPAGGIAMKNLPALLDAEEMVFRSSAEAGRAVLLVDGLDEAAPSCRGYLETLLAKLCAAYPGLRMLVTSRPRVESAGANSVFSAMSHWKMADLDPAQVDDFVDKWCLAAESSVRTDFTEAMKPLPPPPRI